MALQGSSSELVQTVTPQSVVVPTLVPSQLSTIFMQPPGASTSVPESVSSILPSTTTSHPGVIQSHLLSVSTSQPSVASQQVTSAQPTVTMSQQGPSALQDGGLPSQSEGVASQPAALQCQPSVVPSLPGVVSSVPPLGASLSSSTVASDANQVLFHMLPSHTGLPHQSNMMYSATTLVKQFESQFVSPLMQPLPFSNSYYQHPTLVCNPQPSALEHQATPVFFPPNFSAAVMSGVAPYMGGVVTPKYQNNMSQPQQQLSGRTTDSVSVHFKLIVMHSMPAVA